MSFFEPLESRRLLHAGHDHYHNEISFQPAGTSVQPEYIADTGFKYSARPNGFTYGWDVENSPSTRKRASSRSPDIRYDSLTHLQPGGQTRKWELAINNGTYMVRIVAGDPMYNDSTYKIAVEGKTIVSGTPTGSQYWIEGSGTVTVTDGRLTMTSASGAVNNKVNFIDVIEIDPPTEPDEPTEPGNPTQPVAAGWGEVAALPLARTEAQQAIKDGRIYIFGGFFDGSWDATKRVDVYDPATNKWTRLGDMPVAITHAATVIDGYNAIFLGGFVGNDPGPATKDVWKYNIQNRSWTKLPSLPAARGGGGAGIVGTKLYFYGGGTRNASLQHDADYSNTWSLDLANTSSGWQSRAGMPTARNHLAYASVGNKVYAIGGQILNRESSGNQSAVNAYDPATNSWSTVASLPQPLGHVHAGATVTGGRIILAGGVTNGFVNTNGIISYDPATNTWTRVRDLPVTRKSVNMMITGGHIYVVGGGNNTATKNVYKAGWAPTWLKMAASPVSLGEVAAGIIGSKMYMVGEASSKTLIFDITRNTWSQTAATRTYLGHHHAAETLSGKFYLIGGLGAASGKLQIYNPSSNTWSQGPSMPYSAGSVASSVINGKIYVAGGIVGSSSSNTTGSGTVNTAAVFNPATNSWSSISAMPRGVNHAASATDGSKFYVFGGRDGKNVVGNGFNTVQIYNPATNSWTSSESSSIKPMPIGRGGTGKAVFSGGEFYVMGGETSSGSGATSNSVYNRVDIYNPTTNTWRLGPTMPTARHGIFPVLHAGRIYVAAGGVKAAYSNSTVNEVLQVF